MAVCYQTLTLGALSSRIAFSLLVGALFKKFGLFFNKPCSLLAHILTALPEDGHNWPKIVAKFCKIIIL
jgi:hypothetical protein